MPKDILQVGPLQRGRISDDEERLTADTIALARQYGRYGYRKIAGLLEQAGWLVNDKRGKNYAQQQCTGHDALCTGHDALGTRLPSAVRASMALNRQMSPHHLPVGGCQCNRVNPVQIKKSLNPNGTASPSQYSLA